MKKVIIFILLLAIVVTGMSVFHTGKMEAQQLKYNRDFGIQSFGVMVFLTKEMNTVVEKYENSSLTDDELKRHYHLLDEYVLSVYNQKPDKFISNVKDFRFIKKHTVKSFDKDTYKNYMKIVDLFKITYNKITSGESADDRLFMYEIFNSDDFNDKLKVILQDLK